MCSTYISIFEGKRQKSKVMHADWQVYTSSNIWKWLNNYCKIVDQ